MKKIISVTPNNNFSVFVQFDSGEKKVCDLRQFLEKGAFRELKQFELFRQVKNKITSIEWPNEVDLSSDTLDSIGC